MENIQEYLYYIKKTSFQVEAAGYVTIDGSSSSSERNLGDIKNLDSILRNMVVDEVIFAIPSDQINEVKPYFLMCRKRGISVRIAMDFFDQNEVGTVHTVGTIPVFTYQSVNLNDYQIFVKRLADVIFAVVCLLFTILASIIIIPFLKLQIGGTILVSKRYSSVNGRTFNLYRFRTAQDYGHSESFIGKFMRRTSMNNLPMFWNVLTGDMSLVGSAPVPDKGTLLNSTIKNITIKPGLTGTWRFADSSRIKDEDFLAEMDSNYLYKWSFLRDLWLILKTAALFFTVRCSRTGNSLINCMEENNGTEASYSVIR
jgi:lipopolysaccharide/colanic/teichoic acid biosynthesis glycosyltransferase